MVSHQSFTFSHRYALSSSIVQLIVNLCIVLVFCVCHARVRKILNLRIFDDDDGKRWMKSVTDKQFEILCVSQVVLFSDFFKFSDCKLVVLKNVIRSILFCSVSCLNIFCYFLPVSLYVNASVRFGQTYYVEGHT